MNNSISFYGVSYALPDLCLTNEELLRTHPTWRIGQLEERTGVKRRHVAASGETALDLATRAALKLLQEHAIDPQSVDGLILCTQSPEYVMPPGSCILHERLGLKKHAVCFDFNLACSGFVYGVAMARGFAATLGLKRVLLVTADTYSKMIHPEDRSMVVLFGDGAAATCLDLAPQGSAKTVRDIMLYTDGTNASAFRIPAGGARLPLSQETKIAKQDRVGNIRTDEHIHMNGKAIIDFVLREIPGAVDALLARNELSRSDVDLYLFHQASKISLDSLVSLLELPAEKLFGNLEGVGNTVSSSLPILIRDAQDRGVLKPGMKVVLAGFGVGLSWGCCLVDW